MNNFFKKIFDFFLFTSLFVACCGAVMVYQTYTLILDKPVNTDLLAFVFFSTICSYNFHWALTPHLLAPSQRLQWDEKHKHYHLLLSIASLIGAAVTFFFIKHYWLYIGVAFMFSFLYSAPKISFAPFQWLKRIAIGKTIFLALAWTYVTAALPIFIEGQMNTSESILYCIGQFFFIYAICIPFDFRDREEDKAEGIRSMITYFDEKQIDVLFYLSVTIFTVLVFAQKVEGLGWSSIVLLLIPAILLISLYKHTKRSFSDYLYYFVLDGLMMLSGLLLWLVNRF